MDIALNNRVTTEPCPTCGTEARCAHGHQENDRPVHLWDCTACGKCAAHVGCDCRDCVTQITVLVKTAGQHLDTTVIHRAGGCANARRVRADEWERQDMDERVWRDSARCCAACARLAMKESER